MSHEFEDREKGLGELPPTLLRERNEDKDFERKADNSPPSRYPGDIQYQDDIRALPGEMGTVPRSFMVTSVFDALPINARDFRKRGSVTLGTSQNEAPESVFGDFTFTIPDGYIGILRKFKVNFAQSGLNGAILSLDDSLFTTPVLTSLIGDGIIANDNNEMELPLINNNFSDCFVLSNGLKKTGVRIATTMLAQTTWTITFDIEIFGNLLLSKGLPLQYEQANKRT